MQSAKAVINGTNQGFQVVQNNGSISLAQPPPDYSCLRDLRTTDPRDDKHRIESEKGGLLAECCLWVLKNKEYTNWRDDPNNRLLWINGSPGKGKTMLVCGILNDLSARSINVAFFFCQASDDRINTSTAVLRGLIFMLVDQQPSLLPHVQKRYDITGEALFTGINAWAALSQILSDILEDPQLQTTYLVIDALDECVGGLQQLLDFIADKSSLDCRTKWLVSSRCWPIIEESLGLVTQDSRVSLELNEETVARAVEMYIEHQVQILSQRKKYQPQTKESVHRHLLKNAQGTFLWVAIVCQALAKTKAWKTIDLLSSFPPKLEPLYERMLLGLLDSEESEICSTVLGVASTVYRPIMLDELSSMVDMPEDIVGNEEYLAEIVGLCGSFLTLKDNAISLIHQSAKDFLAKNGCDRIFPGGIQATHHTIFLRSINSLSRTLQRNIYNVQSPGCLIEEIQKPAPDPLRSIGYVCANWLDHLQDAYRSRSDLQLTSEDSRVLSSFFESKFLYWLEALSLLRDIHRGIKTMLAFRDLLESFDVSRMFMKRIQDACRFIQQNGTIIQQAPMQTYSSALIFTPMKSLTRLSHFDQKSKWLLRDPKMDQNWGSCLQTIELLRLAKQIEWSHDGKRLAAILNEAHHSVIIWDPFSGQRLSVLDVEGIEVSTMAWSPKYIEQLTVVESSTSQIQTWDTDTGKCIAVFRPSATDMGYPDHICWSRNSTWLAASGCKGIDIWNGITGLWTLCIPINRDYSLSSPFSWSPDGTQIAISSDKGQIRIWDPSNGLQSAFLSIRGIVKSIVWSPDGTQIAVILEDFTLMIWDFTTGGLRFVLSDVKTNPVWSPSRRRLASLTKDNHIAISDPFQGKEISILRDHVKFIRARDMGWSPDDTRLVLCSGDHITLWDPSSGQCTCVLNGHTSQIVLVSWAPYGGHIASESIDNIVKIWETFDNDDVLSNESQPGGLRSGSPYHISWSHDGRLLSLNLMEEAGVWNATADDIITFQGLQYLESICWSPQTPLLAAVSRGQVKIWDSATWNCIWTSGFQIRERDFFWSPDGRKIAMILASHPAIGIWEKRSLSGS
ncbi:hypothetical protein N7468_008872 [Penicillium chermesinum]|uniref:NACHT domain-containing protein n=1 Tax=Penicillium chermesinum TaxID=63820 RepID=A0A9W9NJB8_9EURO|nr:uncharacterized protein N7468_008872 [Penicillium chermesinum]KAJ5219668.1 hypothetical protein N7468_008872 [Penicillium chermesinum]